MERRDIALINPKYLTSAVEAKQYPCEEWPEIAFLGRSNVGKSSLINSLCNQRGLAKVSGAPGKTRTINFFTGELRERIDGESTRHPVYLVDLPGYGFAKTGGKNRDLWSRFIGDYIQTSKRLVLLCLLVDLRHPGLYLDGEAYAWLRNNDIPLQIVCTKADKLNQSEKQKNLNEINRLFPTEYAALAYSSLKGQGKNRLIERFYDVVHGHFVDDDHTV